MQFCKPTNQVKSSHTVLLNTYTNGLLILSIDPSIHSMIQPSNHSCIYPFIHPFIHFIHPSIHPSIHRFNYPTRGRTDVIYIQLVFLIKLPWLNINNNNNNNNNNLVIIIIIIIMIIISVPFSKKIQRH